MYKIFNGKTKTWSTFSSYHFLINQLAQFNEKYGCEVYNSFLAHTGTNEEDTVLITKWGGIEGSRTYEKRENRILDDNGNSLYNKQFIAAVKRWTFSIEIQRQYFKELNRGVKHRYYDSWRYGIPKSAYPAFRSGPWPFIHSHRRYSVYRSIKTTNEKRLTANPEHEEFNRGERGKNLPDSWDETARDWRNTNWKRQGKRKYQWENGVVTKEKHTWGNVYVEKSFNKRFYDMIDDE